jgi:hypothetical protein
METLARRRLTGVAGALLLLVSLIAIVALPALAHTASVTAACTGLKVQLSAYTVGQNHVTVTIDGAVVADTDFNTSFHQQWSWSSGVDHTYTVSVLAWDDPNGTRGWSKSWNGAFQACQRTTTSQPTTTSTAPVTTTTNSTTTTGQQTTTTTGQQTTTTVQQTTTTTGQQTTTTGQQTTTTGQQTTTTTGQQTTTTGQQTTTTGQQTTSSTDPTSTTSGDVGVAGIQVSAGVAAQVTEQTLPFTGISTSSMAVVAAGLAAMGLLLIAVSRDPEEKDPARAWN